MNNIILTKRINEYLTANRRKILLAMGLLVAFLTVYLLTFPASTLDKQTYCGQEEHKHTEECYGENNELICTKTQHEHTLQCYSDPDADVETAEQWEKSFSDVQLTDSVGKNAALIAVSQIGYAESKDNYNVTDEEKELVNGYTRYGDAFGEKYADWSVPFCSFVLHYAGADDKILPKTADAGEWLSRISENDSDSGLAYHAKSDNYEPAAGDIVFLDRNGENDQVLAAIVSDTVEEAGKIIGISAVQGDDEDKVKQSMISADDESIIGYASIISDDAEASEPAGTSEPAPKLLDPQQKTVTKARLAASPYGDAQIATAINEINSGLGLASKTYGGKSFNLSINGTLFTNTFYYDNIARDLPVTGTTNSEKAESYGRYLAGIYLDAGGGSDGLAAVKEVWDRYILDIFDPNQIPPSVGTYGDDVLHWIKENTGSSFHAGSTGSSSSGLSAGIKALDYEALKNGIDYNAFMDNLKKSVTAEAAGDSNTERKYDVRISAEAQAKGKGPVAMIIQIQTAWQLFDLAHANALKDGVYSKYGATSHNEEMANLYDIKKALLQFADYMDEHYKGNNLVIGINEIRHGGSDSMFYSSSVGGAACYVTNDAEKIKEGILGFDSFGNCEHVHYDTNTIKATCTNLSKNLTALTQNVPLSNDDISKCVVIIGGTTEASSGTGGYGCVVPWSTISSSGINSVYGIKTNSAEMADLLNPSYYPSWLDYPANNAGAPYNGTGTNFTQKYKALTAEDICADLIEIAEKEMASKSINIDADTSAEDVILEDTVQREFVLDKSKSVKLNITDNKTNDPVAAECREFEWHDAEIDETTGETIAEGGWFDKATGEPAYDEATGYGLIITENADGTTTVTYKIQSVHNGRVCSLDFGIVARSDYIGSNNVKSNVGTPELTYGYNDNEGNPARVPVETKDKPEVNVPIRYNVKDGGSARVELGTSVDLAKLNSEDIVQDVHSRLESYGQINGTLTYYWELPDGSVSPVPITVQVKDGKVQGDFAGDLPGESDLSELFEAIQSGDSEAFLHVVFSPTPVTENGNFSDSKTAVGVDPLDKPGKVTITTPDVPDKLTAKIRKVWDPRIPNGVTSLEFRLAAYEKGSSTPYNYVGIGRDNKAEYGPGKTITLTENDALTDNDLIWETEIKDLEGKHNKKEVIYKLTEVTDIPGYTPEYTSETVINKVPGKDGEGKFTLKLPDKVPALNNETLTVQYSVGDGNTYSVTVPNVTLAKKQQKSYDHITGLVLQASDAPFGQYTVTNILNSAGKPITYDKGGTKIENVKAYMNEYALTANLTVASRQTDVKLEVKYEYKINGANPLITGTTGVVNYSELPAGALNLDLGKLYLNDTDTVTNFKVTAILKDKKNKEIKNVVLAGNPAYTLTKNSKPARLVCQGVTTFVTTNRESIASVKIEKIVQERLEGVTEDTEFEFRASMKDSGGDSVPFADTTVPADDTHDMTFSADGTSVTFRLKSTESVDFEVPLNNYIEVEEINSAGYYPLIKEYKRDGVYDDIAEIKITKPEGTKITVYNKCGYELPNTGGSGELISMMCGLMLVIFTIVCGLAMRRRSEKGVE